MFLIDGNKVPILYSHCILVDGASRSLINDVHYSKYQAIPNSLFEILTKYKGQSIQAIKDKYNNQYDEVIEEYFDFLVKSDFTFMTNNLLNFPEISKEWESSKIITNGIFEITKIENIEKGIQNFISLNVEALELRFYEVLLNEDLNAILNYFEYTQIKTINLHIKYSEVLKKEDIVELSKNQARISSIIIYESPFEESFKTDWLTNISFLKTTGILSEMCGLIHPNYFACNLPHFTESQHYNTCLNRKISIDVNGEIKNCPSMKKSFGNIKDTTLEEALEKPGFKDLWAIKKDDIEVCKDCEFRHICTDCRAFIKDPENIYSQPAKCPYNPYIAKWEGQEGYITVEESLKAMNSEQLIVNS